MKIHSSIARQVTVLMMALFLRTHQAIAASPLEQALDTIRQASTVDDCAVGFGGERTKTYEAYEVMSDQATKEQLLDFTKDSNANIKACAAMALQNRFPKESFFNVLMAMLGDENSFTYFSGCSQMSVKIGDFYYETLADGLSEDQRAKVLDYLITTNNELETTSIALREWEIPERYLPVIRNLARRGNGSALIALSKFKKAEDYPTIIASARSNPFEVYRCIATNPQPAFFPLLKESHAALLAEEYWTSEQREFYKAVAAFKSPEAVALLDHAIDGNEKAIPMWKYHLDFIYEAVTEHQDPIYDALKWRFWDETNRIDLKNFKHLLALDEARAGKLTRKSLDHLNWEISDEVLAAMFTHVGATDSGYVEAIVVGELGKGEVSRFHFFAGIAKKDKLEKYIEPLFKALETASNPHVFLAAAEALISYRKVDVNQRILAAPDKNDALNVNWGGAAFKNLVAKELRQPEE